METLTLARMEDVNMWVKVTAPPIVTRQWKMGMLVVKLMIFKDIPNTNSAVCMAVLVDMNTIVKRTVEIGTRLTLALAFAKYMKKTQMGVLPVKVNNIPHPQVAILKTSPKQSVLVGRMLQTELLDSLQLYLLLPNRLQY